MSIDDYATMAGTSRRELARRVLAGYESGPDATTRATARALARLDNPVADRVADAVGVCQNRRERDAREEPEQQFRDCALHLFEFASRAIATCIGITDNGALRRAVNVAGEFGKRDLVARFFVGHFDKGSKTEFLCLVIMGHGGQMVTV